MHHKSVGVLAKVCTTLGGNSMIWRGAEGEMNCGSHIHNQCQIEMVSDKSVKTGVKVSLCVGVGKEEIL